MPARLYTVLLMLLACACASDPTWQDHPGWDRLAGERPLEACALFAEPLKQMGDPPAEDELVEGLRLGWSICVAKTALALLHEVVSRAPEDSPGKRARKLLVLLGQEDQEKAAGWARRGARPWKEALVGLLERYPLAERGVKMATPRLAVAQDGAEFRWEGGSSESDPPSAIVVALPGRPPIRVPVPPGRKAADVDGGTVYNGYHLALSADGKRLYLASWHLILCLDATALRMAELKELWRYAPPQASMTAVCVALTSDDRRLIWANRGAGFGHLDALTGTPTAHSNPDTLEALPRSGINTAFSPMGDRILIPAITPAQEEPLTLPGGGRFLPLSGSSQYCRPAVWLSLDAATGAVAETVRNPWSDPDAWDGLTPPSRWAYDHTQPDWVPAQREGTAFCAVSREGQQGRLVLADVANLEIAGQCRTASPNEGGQHGHRVKGAPLSSFAGPVDIIVSDEEMPAVRSAYRSVVSEVHGLAAALDAAGTDPDAMLLTAFGLLAASGDCPFDRRNARVLDAAVRMPFPRVSVPYDHRPSAWRALWDGYLRSPSVGILTLPAGVAPPEPQQPLVSTSSASRAWIRIPVRFKPCGAAISEDAEWVFAGDYRGDLCWVSARTGRHCFRIPGSGPVWDISTFPGRDRAMVVHGAGVYGASLMDMARGRSIAHYSLRSVAKACPVAPGEWLMVDPGSLSYILQEDTGVVGTAYPLWSTSGMPAEPRDAGSLGIAEDGSYALIPARAQRRGDTDPDPTPLWVSYDLRNRAYVGLVSLPEIAVPEAILALEKLKPDKRGRKPEADIVLSVFPWSTRQWVLGDGAGLTLTGTAGAVPIIHVRVGGGGVGGGGRVTTVRF